MSTLFYKKNTHIDMDNISIVLFISRQEEWTKKSQAHKTYDKKWYILVEPPAQNLSFKHLLPIKKTQI